MEELDRRKEEALIAVSLCTGTLIACFGIALALLGGRLSVAPMNPIPYNRRYR